MKRIQSPTKTLTDQQKYLLQRLPGKYEIAEPKVVEPLSIKRMRKAVEAWDEKQRKVSCKVKCEGEKLIVKAREAIYFKPVDQALAMVQKTEMLRKCCDD